MNFFSWIQTACGVLLLLTLISFLPHRRRFFVSEKWGGYIEHEGFHRINTPQNSAIILSIWLIASLCISLHQWTLWALLINLFLCRYYFIQLRWKSLARGMGAPGYIAYWLGASLFFLEFALRFAPSLFPLILQIIQIDFACIFFLAGFYKFKAGYRRGMGMELGLANPQWGYFWRFFKKTRPSHIFHRVNNFLAWSTEMFAALCLVLPPLQILGGILLILIFLYITSCVRLAFLPEMVMLIGCLAFIQVPPFDPVPLSPLMMAIKIGLLAYLCLLPLAYGGLCYNFYLKKSLPQKLQTVLEKYTNFFGMILWRVFSVDVTNFFVQVYKETNEGRVLVSRWGWGQSLRWGHVCEAIAVTCVFTSLKYYSCRSIFEKRLKRYAKTISHLSGEKIIFEYVAVEKNHREFFFKPIREFWVSLEEGFVKEVLLDSSAQLTVPESPIHSGVRPGSYVPLKS